MEFNCNTVSSEIHKLSRNRLAFFWKSHYLRIGTSNYKTARVEFVFTHVESYYYSRRGQETPPSSTRLLMKLCLQVCVICKSYCAQSLWEQVQVWQSLKEAWESRALMKMYWKSQKFVLGKYKLAEAVKANFASRL